MNRDGCWVCNTDSKAYCAGPEEPENAQELFARWRRGEHVDRDAVIHELLKRVSDLEDSLDALRDYVYEYPDR